MQRIPRFLALTCVTAALIGPVPALAQVQVEHIFDYRFGVGFSRDEQAGPHTGAQPMYVGSYTARFHHQTDGGLRFRFDLGVAFGNIDPPSWRDDAVYSPRPLPSE